MAKIICPRSERNIRGFFKTNETLWRTIVTLKLLNAENESKYRSLKLLGFFVLMLEQIVNLGNFMHSLKENIPNFWHILKEIRRNFNNFTSGQSSSFPTAGVRADI